MIVFKAREVKIPKNFAESLDQRASNPVGTLRNKMAELGKLHELDDVILATVMANLLAKSLESDSLTDVGGEPLSLERFSNIVWSMLLAHVIGSIHLQENGLATMGTDEDIARLAELQEADVVEFPDGHRVPKKVMLGKIYKMTSAKVLERVYKECVSSNPITHKKKIKDMYSLFTVMRVTLIASEAVTGTNR